MPAKIKKLITAREGYEIARDQIAGILITERDAQKVLAAAASEPVTDWDFDVVMERTNPIQISENASGKILKKALVNIMTADIQILNNANPTRSQKIRVTYNIDVYGYKNAKTNTDTGEIERADYLSTIDSQRVVRLVRKILMSGLYPSLDLSFVTERSLESVQPFIPNLVEIQGSENIVGNRITMIVTYDEVTVENDYDDIEYIHVTVNHGNTGVVELLYDYT
jgi:hypothetical protein